MLRNARRLGSLTTALLGLALVGIAAPAHASDTMLDLVHELVAQPAPAAPSFSLAPAHAKRCTSGRARAGRAKVSCQVKAVRAGKVARAGKAKAGKAHKAQKDRHGAGRAGRRSPLAARLKLTAAARGSGRIDVIDMSGPVSSNDRPAIAVKTGL